MPLIPREEKYFAMLNQLVGQIRKGADLFVRLFDDIGKNAAYAEEIKKVEVECDRLSAGIIEKLNSTFITPIDREDIYLLATELDDIMDMVNDMARLTVLYGVTKSTPHAVTLARTLMDSVVELEKMFALLESRKGVRDHIERIKALEEEGDRASQTAIQSLFAEEKNPIEVIKWVKIYEEMEAGIDRCKDIAKVVESVVMKNA
jgi:predicted phosphate transport protein (TIGR00153 family)